MLVMPPLAEEFDDTLTTAGEFSTIAALLTAVVVFWQDKEELLFVDVVDDKLEVMT